MLYVGIDPSSKTGLVIIDENGIVVITEEVTTTNLKGPERLIHIVDTVLNRVRYIQDSEKDKVHVAIEGFSYGSKGKGIDFQYGLGWYFRIKMHQRRIGYIEIPPSNVKQFATGKGNTKKENMIMPIYKRWGFESDSDNIRDAFVLAQMSKAIDKPGKLTKDQLKAIEKVM